MSPEVYAIVAILAIPLFFFWRWVFRRNASVIKRQLLTSVLTLLTAPIIYVGIVFLWIWSVAYYPNREFTHRAWKENPEIRYEYSHDLIKRKLLIGKTKTQVVVMLGDGKNFSDDWYYDIGFRPEITGIDPSHIEITFRGGKVIDVVEHDK